MDSVDLVVQQQKKQVQVVVAQAREMPVRTADEVEAAVAFVREVINPRKKEAERIFNDPEAGIVTLAHKSWKAAVKLRDEIIKPYDDARAVIDNKLIDYRARENERLAAEAAKRAERERKERERRIEAATQKIAALLQQTEDIAKQRASLEAVIASGAPEEVAAAEASLTALDSLAEQKSRQIAAEAEMAERIATAPIAIAPVATPKVSGYAGYKKIRAVVVDPVALVAAIANGTVPVGVISAWDTKRLTALLEAGVTVPGVEAHERDVIVIR